MNFLSFGEVLYDVFPDRVTLGGAPLNASVHMTRLSLTGMLISAVGNDELGRKALKEIASYGISTSGIATLTKETGKAEVRINNCSADYTFNLDNAWDNIPLPSVLPEKVDIIYFGTLASRNEVSRNTLSYILDNVESSEIFFDVNIRKSYYSDKIICEGLKKATILKLNDEEVDIVLNAAKIKERDYKGLEKLREKFNLDLILLTRGSRGAMCLKDRWYRKEAEKVEVVDTVGAGDGFSAGFISSYLLDKDILKALDRGTKIASTIVSNRGAIPCYKEEMLKL